MVCSLFRTYTDGKTPFLDRSLRWILDSLPVSLMDFVVLGKSFESEWAKSECLWKWAANLAVTVLFGEMMMNWFCMSFPLNIQVPTSPGPPLRPRFTPAHHDSHAIWDPMEWTFDPWSGSQLMSLCLTYTYCRIYLSIYQSIYLSIYQSINLSIYQSINLSIYRSIYLSIYLSINLSINQSIYQSINLSIYQSINQSICLSIHLSIHPSIHPSINLSIYPSIHLSIYLAIHLSIYLSIHMYICIYVYMYICVMYMYVMGENGQTLHLRWFFTPPKMINYLRVLCDPRRLTQPCEAVVTC